MAKASGFGATEESTAGALKPQGVKFTVKSFEKGVTKATDYQEAGLKMFTAVLALTAPKKAVGIEVTQWFTIGTPEDPKAKEDATWQRKGDPAHMKRLFVRCGAPIPEDDEEFADAIVGHEACAHTSVSAKGFTAIKKGEYYREGDEDFVGVGELLEAAAPAKAAAASAGKKRARPTEDDEDEEKPAKKPAGAKKTAKPADDDDDD